MIEPWKRVEPTEVHTVGWRTIVTKHFELPNGKIEAYDSIGEEQQQFAAVVALDTKANVIIARQFRFGPEIVMDDLPGGVVEGSEDPMVAAERELLEETGYKAAHIELLGTIHKDAYHNGLWHYFLATDCTKVAEQQLDDLEFVEVVHISINELIQKAKDGFVSDAVAVLLAYEKLKALQEA